MSGILEGGQLYLHEQHLRGFSDIKGTPIALCFGPSPLEILDLPPVKDNYITRAVYCTQH